MTVEQADAIIVAISGVEDWRPAFVLGLQSAFVFTIVVVSVIGLIVWGMRR